MFTPYILPYHFDDLEPYIDTLTMDTHYTKHYATYTNNLNTIVRKANLSYASITDLLATINTLQDEDLRTALQHNGGGYYNHTLYFSTIAPPTGGEPTGLLKEAMDKTFGNYATFKHKISTLAMQQFGSGWAWLSANAAGDLQLSSSPNQDNPIIEGSNFTPILGIDVWEHAYYLKYKNLRADYIEQFFNVIDWESVAEKYRMVTQKQSQIVRLII